MQTRREFLMTSAMCVLISGAPPILAANSEVDDAATIGRAPLMIEGDPYTAHADENGLGGRSFDAACEHALRFRMPAELRDRYVLGLE
jgi:hypothetical protein